MNAMELSQSVQKLLENTNSILDIRRRTPPKPGEQFNVFSIINAETDEVDTHCRLLYELLSPNGCHGMGDKFLRAFCEMVLNKPCPQYACVSRERAFSDGRIDLLIEGEGVCYPIEVKVYAEDQYLQISRYAQFASKAPEDHVYYLTLDGHEPSKESIGSDPIPNLTCLSFAGEIREWLLKCGELAWQAPTITETVRQYIGVIDKLTGREQGDEYMSQIQKTVSASRNNFESALAISSALETIKVEKMREVFREIEAHVSKRLKPFKSTYEKDAATYYGPSRRRVWPCIIYPIPHQKCGDLQLALNIEVETNLYYGLVFYKGDCQQVPDEVGQLVDAFPNQAWKKFITKMPHQRSWWLWWKYLPAQEAHLNFQHCSELYPALYDLDSYQEIIAQIFSELDQGIEYMLETGLRRDT